MIIEQTRRSSLSEVKPICGHCRHFLDMAVRGRYYCPYIIYTNGFPPFFNADEKNKSLRFASNKVCKNVDLLDEKELCKILDGRRLSRRILYDQNIRTKERKKLYWQRPDVKAEKRVKQKEYRERLKRNGNQTS